MSSSGISRHPVDAMYRTNRSIQQGNEACNDCCSQEGRTGAIAGAIIGTGIGAGIPPGGVWCLLTAPVGAFIGWIVGESCNDKHRN